MLEELLAADGELTEAELQSLEEKGIAWGVYTEEAIALEQALRAEVQGLYDDINNLPNQKIIDIQLNVKGDLAALQGGQVASRYGSELRQQGRRGRAGGGPVSGGSSYVVGEAGPEIFSPGSSGSVSSNDSLIRAIENSKIDEERLARLIVTGMLKGMAQQ